MNDHRIDLIGPDSHPTGDTLIWRQGSGNTVEIFDISVCADRRREGRGRTMMNILLDSQLPEGTRTVYAITRSTNRIAQQFYEALKFRPVPLYDFYKNDENLCYCDALMYVLDVGSKS